MECCANCKLCKTLEKLDYTHGGCEHTNMDGWICLAFSDEDIASWMVGLNEETAHCEAYISKTEKG